MKCFGFFLVAVCGIVAADDVSAKGVEIRSTDGKVFVAADEIVSYDWATHTLTLKDGVRKALAERFKRYARKQNLIKGIPFEVSVDGKKVYGGTWKSCESSIGSASVVSLWGGRAIYKELEEDQLRIDPCYPRRPGFKGEDPRSDELVKTALKAAKKLK